MTFKISYYLYLYYLKLKKNKMIILLRIKVFKDTKIIESVCTILALRNTIEKAFAKKIILLFYFS